MNTQTRRQACSNTEKARDRRLRIFAKAVEDAALCYLMYAALWSLCHVVSAVFERLGVA